MVKDLWDEQAAATPEDWVKKYSQDKQYVDHYFVDITATFLNRRIVIYPVFEDEVCTTGVKI